MSNCGELHQSMCWIHLFVRSVPLTRFNTFYIAKFSPLSGLYKRFFFWVFLIGTCIAVWPLDQTESRAYVIQEVLRMNAVTAQPHSHARTHTRTHKRAYTFAFTAVVVESVSIDLPFISNNWSTFSTGISTPQIADRSAAVIVTHKCCACVLECVHGCVISIYFNDA